MKRPTCKEIVYERFFLVEGEDRVKQAVKLKFYQIFYGVNPQYDSRLQIKSSLAKFYQKEAQKAFTKLSEPERKEYHKIKDGFGKYKPLQLKKALEKYLGYKAANDPSDPVND